METLTLSKFTEEQLQFYANFPKLTDRQREAYEHLLKRGHGKSGTRYSGRRILFAMSLFKALEKKGLITCTNIVRDCYTRAEYIAIPNTWKV